MQLKLYQFRKPAVADFHLVSMIAHTMVSTSTDSLLLSRHLIQLGGCCLFTGHKFHYRIFEDFFLGWHSHISFRAEEKDVVLSSLAACIETFGYCKGLMSQMRLLTHQHLVSSKSCITSMYCLRNKVLISSCEPSKG